MKHSWSIIGVTIGMGVVFSAVSCARLTPTFQQCEDACSAASRCGLLPSALGGSPGLSREDNEDDCVARCLASDRDKFQVEGLLEVLGEAGIATQAPLCDFQGTMACEELVETLDGTRSTSELEVTATLTVRMISALSEASNFSAESWCCFDYDREIDETQDGNRGMRLTADDLEGPRNEINAVHDMFEPTHRCLDYLQTQADAAIMVFPTDMKKGAEPEPTPDEAVMACGNIRLAWDPPPDPDVDPADDPDLVADPCYFARMSTRLSDLGVLTAVDTCSLESMQALSMDAGDYEQEWGLRPGGLLINDDGTARSAEEIKRSIHEEIRDEVTRPMGFLHEACEELDDEAGGSAEAGCVLVDETGVADENPCRTGPACSAADCLDETLACDTTLCDADVSPPGRDCGFFGITEVTLGYRTDTGLEVFGEPVSGCSTLTSLETTFDDVRIGSITPIAIVSGTLPTSFNVEGDQRLGDGSYSWYVEGGSRWVTAGTVAMQLPSPLLEYVSTGYENPLEYLGWVNRRMPTGQECDNQPALCEGFFNGNCDDGIDNDGDGQIDGESAWCDLLFGELADRCVVSEPGREAFPDCIDRD
ncbi:MAG: hypothetical protein AAF799_11040 [Myxococcota bacterium]